MNAQTSSIIPYTIKPGDVLWKIAETFNTTIYAIGVLNPGLDINQLRPGETIFVWPGLGTNIQSIIPKGQADVFTRSEVELNKLLRMLWQQDAAWTRQVMTSTIFNLPDLQANVSRLNRTSRDMEQTLRRFYPDTVTVKIGTLFKEYNDLIAKLMTAAKNGDNKTVAAIQSRLKQTADQIAEYLASINTYWKKETWQEMLYQYLDLLYAQIDDTIGNRFEASINSFNEAEIRALTMADYMTNGIITQFRDRFF